MRAALPCHAITPGSRRSTAGCSLGRLRSPLTSFGRSPLRSARRGSVSACVAASLVTTSRPIPPPVATLLSVARLRSACVARGITEVTSVKGSRFGGPDHIARCSPVVLPLSRQTRLTRLHRDARYKEAQKQVHLPLKKPSEEDLASQLLELLRDLVPVSAPVVVGDGPG